MDRKIKVLGVEIDNYYLDEVMTTVVGFLENDSLNTIDMITTSLLMAAEENMQLKDHIEQMDITIIGDIEVLAAANIQDEKRYEEVAQNEFLGTLLMYAANCEKSICLLVESEKQLEEFEEYFKEQYENLSIVKSFVLDGENQDVDDVINEINSLSPDILLASLQSPFQEAFILENKLKLSAKLYVGLGKYKKINQSLGLKPGWLSKLLDRTLFKHMVSKYKGEKGE